MSERKFELYTNKLNKNLFYFLIREYYSHSINPFVTLKNLMKIIHSKISENLKQKCASFLFQILFDISVLDNIDENSKPIINDMLDNLLTRKVDFYIVISYAIFLTKTKQVQKAITTLLSISNENRFINCGEIIFFRVLIEYTTNDKTEKYVFVKGLEKCFPLIKKGRNNFLDFICDFCSKDSEMWEIFKNETLKNYIYNGYDKIKGKFISNVIENHNEDLKSIKTLCDLLQSNTSSSVGLNFELILKLKKLIDVYVEDNIEELNNNFYTDFNKINTIEKIAKVLNDLSYGISYIKFVLHFYLFNVYDELIYQTLMEILETLLVDVNDKKVYFNNDIQRELILFYKNIIFILTKKVKKDILVLLKKQELDKEKEILNAKVYKVLNVINITKKIITGEVLVVITDKMKNKFVSKDFVSFIQKISVQLKK